MRLETDRCCQYTGCGDSGCTFNMSSSLDLRYAKQCAGNNILLQRLLHGQHILNLFLHLLFNIISTLVIALSNFFMQVLNAPTREEVDCADAKKRWLEIGVPSIRNAFHVSKFKTLSWMLFNFSSIPIHILFNSTNYESDYQGSQWRLTLASEAFFHGSKYYGPGAGLMPNGDYGISQQRAKRWICRMGPITGLHGNHCCNLTLICDQRPQKTSCRPRQWQENG